MQERDITFVLTVHYIQLFPVDCETSAVPLRWLDSQNRAILKTLFIIVEMIF